MPEIDDLLDQAVKKVEAVARAADDASAEGRRLLEAATALREKLEAQIGDSRASMAEMEKALDTAARGISDKTQDLLPGLQSLHSRQGDLEHQVEDLADRVHRGLADIRDDEEHFVAEAGRQVEAAESKLLGYAERVREAETEAAARLQTVREALAAAGGRTEAVRGVIQERRDILRAQLGAFEASAHDRLAKTLDGFDLLDGQLLSQVEEVAKAVMSQADRTADAVKSQFEHHARERLVLAAETLKQRLHGLQDFAHVQRQRLGEQLRTLASVGKDESDTCWEAVRNARLR